MSLNDLQLSPGVLARLYPATLINTEETHLVRQITSIAEPVPMLEESQLSPRLAWKSLGDNLKNILIVVNYDSVMHLPDDELGFLTNMLSACKMSLGDVAIINRKNFNNISSKEILEHFQSKTIFLFGVEPAVFGLPVSFPYFQVQSVDAKTYLYTPALEERHTDSLLKSKLWVSLRSIFGI